MLYITYFKKEKNKENTQKETADHVTNTNKFNEKFSSENNTVSINIRNTKDEFDSDEFRNIFQAKYPFVSIYVPPSKRSDFIKECDWLKEKVGHFPSKSEQMSILESLSYEDKKNE
jgi:hypothetical protein